MTLLVVGVLLTLGCVNASDDNATLQSSSPLNDLIINANDNDTIYLDNITYTIEEITIDKSLNFVGLDNTIIDGQNANSLFKINDNVRVSFKNIKFVNASKTGTGEDVYGGALEIAKADVLIDNCQFITNSINYGNSDYVFGAAISNMGNLTIINSYFYQNFLNSGYLHDGFGGAIYNNGLLYVDNTSFIKSQGGERSRGSVIYNDNIALINNSIIADTYSFEDSMGSAIFNNADMTLINSIVENNTIERNNFNYIYGTIFNSGYLKAYYNIFKNNTGYYLQPNQGYEGCPTIYNVGDLDLSYNAFIDNIGGFAKIYTDVFLNGGMSVNIDNNWWGSNADPFTTQSINVDMANSWFVLDVTPSYSILEINEQVNVTASWKLSDGLEPEILLPLNVKFSDEFGNSQVSNLADGQCIFTFNNTQEKGLFLIDVNLYSFNQSVIVDVGKIKTSIEFTVNQEELFPNEKLVVNVKLYDDNHKSVMDRISLTVAGQTKIIDLNYERSVSFNNLLPDIYELKIEYNGSEVYSKSSASTNITVKKYPIKLSIEEIGDVYVDEDFTINILLKTEEMEGAANLYINGEFKNIVYLKTGGTIVSFSNFDEGFYNLTIEIVGDEYYEPTNASAIFNVKKYDSELGISSSDIFIMENETLTITASEDFIGNVILSINGVNNTLFINDSTTDITLSNLPEGLYDVDLIFKGNGKFYGQNASTSFNVLKYPSNLVVDINDNQINVKTIPSNCTGYVGVYVNRRYYQLDLIGGEANFNVEYDDGTNYIHVFYSGDDYYNQSAFDTTYGKSIPFVILGVNVTGYEYNDFNFTVQVFEKNGFAIPNIVICVKIGSITYDVLTNEKGEGILPLNLMEGYYEVTSTYENLTTTNLLTILPIEFNLTSNYITYGEAAVITAEFDKNVTGNVNFTLNDLTEVITIVDGKAVLRIENLGFGIFQVNAFYTNDLFNSTVKTTTFEVERFNSTIILDIKETFIGDVEVIVAKADNLTGNIAFIVDDDEYCTEITAGQAIVTVPNLSGGLHRLKVNYEGDSRHKNTTLITDFYIKTKKTDIALTIDETPYGEDILVIAKVNASGTMIFKVNNLVQQAQIEDGIATATFNGLNVGQYLLEADYLGNEEFLSTSKTTQFNVIKAQSSVEIYVNEIVLDENIRIYAKVSSNATGKVSFKMEGYYSPRDKIIENGIATWLIAPLQTGEYNVSATYSGDDNYYSSSADYILKVSQKRSFLSVEVNDVSTADNVLIMVTLTSLDENITGVVNVKFNDKSYNINVIDSKGSLYIGKLTPGEYTIKATYEGDENFSSAKASCDFKVSDTQMESILTTSDVVKYFSSDKKVIFTLTNDKMKALSGETIHVRVNGVLTTFTTDSEGKIYLDIGDDCGNYTVFAEFEGSMSYHGSNATANVEVLSTIESSDVVKLYGSGDYYFAIFMDLDGKALSNTNVTFKIDGKIYTYTTYPNGIIRLNINLNPGKYPITAFNPKTGENKTNTLTIFNRLMENKNIVNYFGVKSTYKVRAYGDGGKVVAGVYVTFKVNGKTYKVKTDKNGYAKISVSLNPKQYTVTAVFNGTKVSNKITVKPVLTTKITSNKKTKMTKFTAKLVNTKGKALKGKKITFKIKGKKYKAKTNNKGIAHLNIRLTLKKGTYKVITSYGKAKAINTIRIK